MFATSGATSTVEANDTKSVSAKPGQPNNHAIARAELDATVVDSSLDLLERLVLVGGNELPRTVAIVGLQPAGGATTVAAHVAAAMTGLLREDASTENGRVLLIDGNLIESGVVNHFSNLSGDGLSQWLSDGSTAGSLARVIRRTDNSRLDVLPAGSNAKQLVGRLGDAIQAAKELGYRSVVIDLPPLSKSETAARIAGTCDATILVADYGKSNREMLRQMLSRLNESGATIAGAVLNRRQFPVPKSLYNLF